MLDIELVVSLELNKEHRHPGKELFTFSDLLILIGQNLHFEKFEERTNEKSGFSKRTFTNGMIVIPVIQVF